MKDPWIDAAERYPAGGKYKGKVVGVVDYGAFVELEPGIEGLVHVTEMSWAKKPTHPSKVVKAGEEVDVVVLDIKPSDRRVSLGIKQAQPDPWLLVAEKYPVGTVVTGKVRNIAEFGAFIEIEDGFDGLVHVSDVSWTGPGEESARSVQERRAHYRKSPADRSGEPARISGDEAGQRHLGRLV